MKSLQDRPKKYVPVFTRGILNVETQANSQWHYTEGTTGLWLNYTNGPRKRCNCFHVWINHPKRRWSGSLSTPFVPVDCNLLILHPSCRIFRQKFAGWWSLLLQGSSVQRLNRVSPHCGGMTHLPNTTLMKELNMGKLTARMISSPKYKDRLYWLEEWLKKQELPSGMVIQSLFMI